MKNKREVFKGRRLVGLVSFDQVEQEAKSLVEAAGCAEKRGMVKSVVGVRGLVTSGKCRGQPGHELHDRCPVVLGSSGTVSMLSRRHVLENLKKKFEEEKKILKRLPKLTDPGRFAVPCAVLGVEFKDSLCDTGSSVNLMSMRTANKFGMTRFQEATRMLRFANNSTMKPEGFLPNVNLRIADCLIETDFHVIEMVSDVERPLILVKEAYARAKSAKSPTNPQALFIEERSCVWNYVDLRFLDDEDEVCICEELDDLVFGELEAGEGTRMDISVSVPPKPHPLVGTSSISAAHENQKEPYLSVGTSFISAAHENQKEPHPSVGTYSISVPYSNTCSTTEKGIGNNSLDLLPAPHRSPIPIGGVHSTQGADDIYINKYFMNKAELMQKMRTWELEYKFEFRIGETERNREGFRQRRYRIQQRRRDSGGGDEIPAEATRSLVEDENFGCDRRRRLGQNGRAGLARLTYLFAARDETREGSKKIFDEIRRSEDKVTLRRRRIDPGPFLIRVTIGETVIDKCLCDSGSKCNIMSEATAIQLGMTNQTPSCYKLRMEDDSFFQPIGELLDEVLVIENTQMVLDFHICKLMESSPQLILGRDFLSNIGAVIDYGTRRCRAGTVSRRMSLINCIGSINVKLQVIGIFPFCYVAKLISCTIYISRERGIVKVPEIWLLLEAVKAYLDDEYYEGPHTPYLVDFGALLAAEFASVRTSAGLRREVHLGSLVSPIFSHMEFDLLPSTQASRLARATSQVPPRGSTFSQAPLLIFYKMEFIIEELPEETMTEYKRVMYMTGKKNNLMLRTFLCTISWFRFFCFTTPLATAPIATPVASPVASLEDVAVNTSGTDDLSAILSDTRRRLIDSPPSATTTPSDGPNSPERRRSRRHIRQRTTRRVSRVVVTDRY
ncbi:unnamed protein product [Arabidopsis lyrata]|nr:unnamed protein product [Arabidopsis lyrata]